MTTEENMPKACFILLNHDYTMAIPTFSLPPQSCAVTDHPIPHHKMATNICATISSRERRGKKTLRDKLGH